MLTKLPIGSERVKRDKTWLAFSLFSQQSTMTMPYGRTLRATSMYIDLCLTCAHIIQHVSPLPILYDMSLHRIMSPLCPYTTCLTCAHIIQHVSPVPILYDIYVHRIMSPLCPYTTCLTCAHIIQHVSPVPILYDIYVHRCRKIGRASC